MVDISDFTIEEYWSKKMKDEGKESKSYVIRFDEKPGEEVRKNLRKGGFGCSWNSYLEGGGGWLYPKSSGKIEELRHYLETGEMPEDPTPATFKRKSPQRKGVNAKDVLSKIREKMESVELGEKSLKKINRILREVEEEMA